MSISTNILIIIILKWDLNVYIQFKCSGVIKCQILKDVNGCETRSPTLKYCANKHRSTLDEMFKLDKQDYI